MTREVATKPSRNYGIDLLRFVLMFMVCLLHILKKGGILSSLAVGSANYNIAWFIEIASFCAVDCFAMISGYTASNRPRKYEKLINMWFQVIFYSFILTGILTILKINPSWSISEAIKSLFPVTFGSYWYFTAYFLLFLAVPLLDKFLFALEEKDAKRLLIVVVILGCIMGAINDPFKTSAGYSAIWLMFLYIIGFAVKKIGLFEKTKTYKLILLWLFSIIATLLVKTILGSGILISYISPTIVLIAIIMLVLFSRLSLSGIVLAKITPLVFGIYLFQLNRVIWNTVLDKRFAFLANLEPVVMLTGIFLFALGLFIAGLCVEFIRYHLANFIGIPKLSKKISDFIDKVLEKASRIF